MTWKDQQSQPRGDVEKANIASEAFGGQGKGKPRAPKFHRMSITAAENGVSINHTMKVKTGKTSKTGARSGSSFPMSGSDDGVTEKNTEHVFGNDHPVMHHLHAIHKHIASNIGGMGDFTDPDGDGD